MRRALSLGIVGWTTAIGAAVVSVAVWQSIGVPPVAFCLLVAGAILTEQMQVAGEDAGVGAGSSAPFSFSLGIHVAAVLLLGSWVAALVAAVGVLVVDGLRGTRWRPLVFNASVFAIAAAAGGAAFHLSGGTPGALRFPADAPRILALAATLYGLNTFLVAAAIATTSRERFWQLTGGMARAQVVSASGETSLGVALALFADTTPWAIVLLVPLVVALYQARSRLAAHRRETARALETFASVIDDRDPYTARHSARVAEYVEELAEALSFPASDVARLRWAARLHDLGKVAVDNSILHKPGKPDPAEWEILRSHPLLSARIVRRFRFASAEAKAVEYHHERFDGHGYFGASGAEVPLAAHFLVVADTYDAMTTDRPYRKGLAPELALAEIERGSGTQFHPAVARAFVALRRGQPPLRVLSPEERAGLEQLWTRQRGRARVAAGLCSEDVPQTVCTLAIAAGCFASAAHASVGAFAAFAVACAAPAWDWRRRRRARGLEARLRRALDADTGPPERLQLVVSQLAAETDLRWGCLFGPQATGGAGVLGRRAEWNFGPAPTGTSILAWLQREAEPTESFSIGDGDGLGRGQTYAALAFEGDDGEQRQLVLGFSRRPPRRVELALRACAGSPWRVAETPAQTELAAAS